MSRGICELARDLFGVALSTGAADAIGDLVATEPPPRTPLLDTELAAAPTAPLRVVIDDLIDLILRPRLPPRTPMPRLPACLAMLTLPTHQLLGPCPCLPPPLRSRLRRIR